MAYYTQGSTVRIAIKFTSTAGADADPTTVTFKYKAPGRGWIVLTYPTDAALVKDSTGDYHVDITADHKGVWYYQAIGDAIESPKNLSFEVVEEAV